LLAEAKFQSVGPSANLSGEAFSSDPKLMPTGSPVVPEPASLALIVAGLAFMLPRRRSKAGAPDQTSSTVSPTVASISAPTQESSM
jgi:hypothetical protein